MASPRPAELYRHRIQEFQLVRLKRIAEALLLHTPAYADRDALPLAVPGEVLGEPCCFAKTVLVWASPANPGADTLAGDLRAAFAGIDVTMAEEMPPRATHMLLYLCEATWSDEALADQVRSRRG